MRGRDSLNEHLAAVRVAIPPELSFELSFENDEDIPPELSFDAQPESVAIITINFIIILLLLIIIITIINIIALLS